MASNSPVARMDAAAAATGSNSDGATASGEDIPFGSLLWFAEAGISCVLVLFAGIMWGLTLGLMTLGRVELEILQRRAQQPRSGRQILDCALGHGDSALFRRAQLKALISIHSKEAGKGGELTHVETAIISGALDLTQKSAEEAMIPIESTFSLDVNSKLDWEAFSKIQMRGHSRVPVYSENSRNIIGFLLVKSLQTVRAETKTPVSVVSIRRIPRVPADMPLYDVLNKFQKGSSHMAAVVKTKAKTRSLPPTQEDKSDDNKGAYDKSNMTTPLLSKEDSSFVVDIDKGQEKYANSNNPTSMLNDNLSIDTTSRTSEDIEDRRNYWYHHS